MRAVTPTLTNCVVLLAAVLSPLHAFQGTPAFCFLVGCGGVKEITTQAESNQGSCGCQHWHASQTKPVFEQSDSSAAGDNGLSPHSPCKCPPNCLCRRSPQPQQVPVVENQVEPSEAVALLPVEAKVAKATFAFHGGSNYAGRSDCSSALDLCAALCRFTT